jgi:hypothetical protein
VAHAWLLENVPPQRRVQTATVEGFCEFLAYQVMEGLGDSAEAERIAKGDLAHGQLATFQESAAIYGFYRILEWMQYGLEDCLVAGDTDRVRRLDERLKPERREARQVIPPSSPPARGPEQLVLRSILGTGSRRLALINNVSLAIGEEGRARVGTNLVQLKCLEIRENAVLVQVEGAVGAQELQLERVAQR